MLSKGHRPHLLCIICIYCLLVYQAQFATTASSGQNKPIKKAKRPISKQEADFLRSPFALCKGTRPLNVVDAVMANAFASRIMDDCLKHAIPRVALTQNLTVPDAYAATKVGCLISYFAYGYFSAETDRLVSSRGQDTESLRDIAQKVITAWQAGGKVLKTQLANGRKHKTDWTAVQTMFDECFACISRSGGLPRNGDHVLFLLKYTYRMLWVKS